MNRSTVPCVLSDPYHGPMSTRTSAQAFIERWEGVTASELATAQTFVMDLCELLEVPKPHATPAEDYMFERPITFSHGDGSTSTGRIDCYKRGHFVLEAKKLKAGTHTKGFDDGLLRARSQGEGYARALPPEEGRPPFVMVVDVGNVIEVYAEFPRSGGTYTPVSLVSGSSSVLNWTGSLNINLAPLGSERLETQHRVDLRAEKLFNFDVHRFGIFVDVQNLFNADTITSVQTRVPSRSITYAGPNGQPTSATVLYKSPLSLISARQLTFGGRWSF